MPDVLQDATSGERQFLPCGALLPQGVTKLVVFENDTICVEAAPIAALLSHVLGEVAWRLFLN